MGKLSDKIADQNEQARKIFKERFAELKKIIEDKNDGSDNKRSVPSSNSKIDASKRPSFVTQSLQTQTDTLNVEDEEYTAESKLVFPDKESPNSLLRNLDMTGSLKIYSEYARDYLNKPNKRVQSKNDPIYAKLEPELVAKIEKKFMHLVVKKTQTEVILKFEKYGFEFVHNVNDGRYFVNALLFTEPYNPLPNKMMYQHVWIGKNFIAYGFKTAEETIDKMQKMMESGQTGPSMFKDFLVDYNVKTKRIIADSDKCRLFTYSEYEAFQRWFSKNQIYIMVKNTNVYDAEDFQEEQRQLRAQGKQVSAFQLMKSKMLPTPRKSNLIVAMPMPDPQYKGNDYADPKNKLYKIGFLYA